MAYDSPKAASLKLFVNEEVKVGSLSTTHRWRVAQFLRTNGITNLLSVKQRTQARHLLNSLPSNLTNGGQYRFELDYPLD